MDLNNILSMKPMKYEYFIATHSNATFLFIFFSSNPGWKKIQNYKIQMPLKYLNTWNYALKIKCRQTNSNYFGQQKKTLE